MLPVALPSQARPSLPSLLVHRLLRPSHCDYQLAWQALVQLVVSPSPARQMTLIHRQAKGRYARDDPAFLVLSVGFVAFTALVYGLMCVAYIVFFCFCFCFFQLFVQSMLLNICCVVVT
jgi:hypothetical protein